MVNEIVIWVIGGGCLTFISSLLTLKYSKKSAEADAMKKMQDVYQEMITDLRKELQTTRTDMSDLRADMARITTEQRENKRLIDELKPFKCTDLQCLKRK